MGFWPWLNWLLIDLNDVPFSLFVSHSFCTKFYASPSPLNTIHRLLFHFSSEEPPGISPHPPHRLLHAFGFFHFFERESEMFQLWIKASIVYKILCKKGIISVHQEYIRVVY